MRITFVNTIPIWGGGERWTLEAAQELQRRGHAVELIAASKGKLLERARAVPLQAGVFADGWRWRMPLLWGHRAAARQPDIWLANCLQDLWLVHAIQLGRRKRPIVFRRGLDAPLPNNLRERRRFAGVNLVLANSHATRLTLLRSLPWLSGDRVEVLYNPIWSVSNGAPASDLRQRLSLPSDILIVGVAARLDQQKGHAPLFRAWRKVVTAHPGARLLLAGEGPLRRKLQDQAWTEGIASNCIFLGQVEPIQPFFEACDVIAVPSLFEGFCFSALEAQLLGRPVLASNVSSLPEIVRDGETGFLISGDNPDAWAARIVQLARDAGLRARLGTEGRRQALQKFAARPIYDRLEALLLAQIAGSA